MTDVDIHVLCGCVKEFLRLLNEPLVTNALWGEFTRAVESRDRQDVAPALYQCVNDLPPPNRDTLAYMMLHLQKYVDLGLFTFIYGKIAGLPHLQNVKCLLITWLKCSDPL